MTSLTEEAVIRVIQQRLPLRNVKTVGGVAHILQWR